MKEDKYISINNVMDAFNFSAIQDFFTILLVMNKNDISHKDMIEYRDEKRIRLMNNDKPIAKTCPLCKSPMVAELINVSPRTMTNDDSTTVYSCRNYECMHQIFE